ncbi:MAG TPA: DNA-binding response regulator, partial [Thermoanaerobaculia bacterium]
MASDSTSDADLGETFAAAGSAIRILVVGPDPLARGGLAALLTGEPGYRVVAQLAVGDGDEAADAEALPPADVALWDLGLSPPEGGLERLAAAAVDGPPILALAASVEQAADALAAGAHGALLRGAPAAQLKAATAALA